MGVGAVASNGTESGWATFMVEELESGEEGPGEEEVEVSSIALAVGLSCFALPFGSGVALAPDGVGEDVDGVDGGDGSPGTGSSGCCLSGKDLVGSVVFRRRYKVHRLWVFEGRLMSS